MAPLFKLKNKDKLITIFDIGSGSVGGGIGNYNAVSKGTIFAINNPTTNSSNPKLPPKILRINSIIK